MDANYLISNLFPTKSLRQSAEEHPLLHSQITELQVHTLLDMDFSAREVWTRNEIYAHLSRVAEGLNSTAVTIHSNRLTDEGCFSHYVGNPTILPKVKGEKEKGR
jgi:hypothetical protein